MRYFTTFCVRERGCESGDSIDCVDSGVVEFSSDPHSALKPPSAEVVMGKLPERYHRPEYEVVVSERGSYSNGVEAVERCPFSLKKNLLRVRL